MVLSYSSEFDVVVVCQLKFFADVLAPGGVEGDQIWEEMGAHWSLDHVRVVKHFLVVIAFHPTTCSFNIFAIIF